MIRVRVDDFPQTKGEPQHTLAAYREFHRCLSECIGGRRYLLGVIPGRCTVDDLLFLRNETDCVIGMHGTDHAEDRLDRNGGNQFEPYLTGNEISRILWENRCALEGAIGRPITMYMPPRNVIDLRTAAAIRNAGFERFTTGPETSPVVRAQNVLSEVHSSKQYEYGRTDEMFRHGQDQALVAAGTSGDVVLTLHWTWETNIGLDHMRQFFGQIPQRLFEHFDD